MADSDEAKELADCRRESDLLRAENATMRPMVSELQRKLRNMERNHDPAKAETEPLVRKSREHA